LVGDNCTGETILPWQINSPPGSRDSSAGSANLISTGVLGSSSCSAKKQYAERLMFLVTPMRTRFPLLLDIGLVFGPESAAPA